MFKLIICLFVLMNVCMCKTPITYYPNIGETLRLQCSGSYFCFSTYTFSNITHPMVMLNSSQKYQVQGGSLAINNVEATDAGYYACSSNCLQMKADQIDYYVHPVVNSQPIDVSSIFLAVPPFPGYNSEFGLNVLDNNFYPATQYPPTRRASGLNDGEIAGIVIGCLAFVVIVAAILAFIFVCTRRPSTSSTPKKKKEKKSKREEITEEISGGNQPGDYSTIDKDFKPDTLKSDKSLIPDDRSNRNRNNDDRNRYEIDDTLPNVDIHPNDRQQTDERTKRNQDFANKLVNKFKPTDEQDPKQISSRYDSYNNSFSTGLDAPSPNNKNQNQNQNQNQNGNIYSLDNSINGQAGQSIINTNVKRNQRTPSDEHDQGPLPTQQKPPINRNKIDWGTSAKPQQPTPSNRDVLNTRQYSDRSGQDSFDQNVNKSLDIRVDYDAYGRKDSNKGKADQDFYPRDYELSDDMRQDSSDGQQQPPPPSFKSMVRATKQQKTPGQSLPSPPQQQPPPPPLPNTSRSYQGAPATTTAQNAYQQNSNYTNVKSQNVQQLPKQYRSVYDANAESVRTTSSDLKDNGATDV